MLPGIRGGRSGGIPNNSSESTTKSAEQARRHRALVLPVAAHVCRVDREVPQTGGAFDISIDTGLSSLELDEDACLVRATAAGVRLDLGGIGKGFAVDMMADVLEEWGLRAALVHGGFSSVLAFDGPDDGEGWPLTLRDPAAPARVLARLSACQTSLGASGLAKGDHIVDPRTGQRR